MRAGKVGAKRSQLVDDIEDGLALATRLHILEVDHRISVEVDEPFFRRPSHVRPTLARAKDAATPLFRQVARHRPTKQVSVVSAMTLVIQDLMDVLALALTRVGELLPNMRRATLVAPLNFILLETHKNGLLLFVVSHSDYPLGVGDLDPLDLSHLLSLSFFSLLSSWGRRGRATWQALASGRVCLCPCAKT